MAGSFSLETSPRADRESKEKTETNQSKRWKNGDSEEEEEVHFHWTHKRSLLSNGKSFSFSWKILLLEEHCGPNQVQRGKSKHYLFGEFFFGRKCHGKKNCRRTHLHTQRVRKSWQTDSAWSIDFSVFWRRTHEGYSVQRRAIDTDYVYWFWKQWSVE